MKILIELHRMRLMSMDTSYMGASTSDLVDEEDMGGVRDAIAQALMENA